MKKSGRSVGKMEDADLFKMDKNAQVKIRYTHLEGQGPIPFRAGKKDQKKGQKRRDFFFFSRPANLPKTRSVGSAPAPLGIRAA